MTNQPKNPGADHTSQDALNGWRTQKDQNTLTQNIVTLLGIHGMHCAFQKYQDASHITKAFEQLIAEAIAEERDSIIRILEKIDYDVDVNKEPTIVDEAWANQYDSKAEAFWYGEAEGMKALKGAIKVIQHINQPQDL